MEAGSGKLETPHRKGAGKNGVGNVSLIPLPETSCASRESAPQAAVALLPDIESRQLRYDGDLK